MADSSHFLSIVFRLVKLDEMADLDMGTCRYCVCVCIMWKWRHIIMKCGMVWILCIWICNYVTNIRIKIKVCLFLNRISILFLPLWFSKILNSLFSIIYLAFSKYQRVSHNELSFLDFVIWLRVWKWQAVTT